MTLGVSRISLALFPRFSKAAFLPNECKFNDNGEYIRKQRLQINPNDFKNPSL